MLFGDSKMPLYVLNVTYPLVDEEVKQSASATGGACD